VGLSLGKTISGTISKTPASFFTTNPAPVIEYAPGFHILNSSFYDVPNPSERQDCTVDELLRVLQTSGAFDQCYAPGVGIFFIDLLYSITSDGRGYIPYPTGGALITR